MQVLTDLKTKQDFQDVQDLAGFCFAAWSIDMQVLTDLKTKQDFQDVQDLAGFCFAAWSIDMQVLTDLKTRFPNPENPENLGNPAHILLIS